MFSANTPKPRALAMKHEVQTGKAYIYTTVEGTQPKRYEIEIEKLSLGEDENVCFTYDTILQQHLQPIF